MVSQKRWRVKSPNAALQKIMSAELGISNILAQLLINRGIYTIEQARSFLGSELDRLFSPWLLKDMDKAVERILLACKNRELIMVYGDYDVDGITGTTVLLLALRRLGCQVDFYIPHRLEEGYGLNNQALARAAAIGVKLVVTVDCGISGAEEISYAKTLGLEVIITDHHEPPECLPEAKAVIDPKRHDCCYPFKELAGVGVAMKLIQALYQRAGLGPREWEDFLDLICLGTVADIVPLQGENRIIVKHGLPKINSTPRPGIKALIKVSGFKTDNIGTRELGFGLAPRLNAAGRMGDATLGVDLLLSSEEQAAEEIAETLNNGNQERQQVEARVLTEALAMLEGNPELANKKAVVLASTNWHPGVIGIVASRLVDRLFRPVFMISIEEGKGKGSARSIPGFNLYQAMVNCHEHLEQFGGHAMAAGFSIDEAKITEFRQAMVEYAQKNLSEEHLIPNLDLDAIVDFTDLSMDTVLELEQLSPFGHCNPGPMLGCCEATVLNCREVGKNGGHLKMRVSREKVVLDGIGFNLASYGEMLAAADTVDMAFVPSINVWNGRTTVQLEVKELKETRESLAGIQDNTYIRPQEQWEILNCSLTNEMIFDSIVPAGIMELCNRKESIGIPAGVKIDIEDNRNCPDRLARLGQLLKGSTSSLVLAESTSQVLQLANYLFSTGKYSYPQLSFYHPHMSSVQVQGLIEAIGSGQIRVLITTGFTPLPMSKFMYEQLVVFHLPYSEKECKVIGTTGVIRAAILAGEAQLPDAHEQIMSLAPERGAMGELYKLLRLNYETRGYDHISLEDICSCLRKFYPRAASHTADICFKTFQELGLVEYIKTGSKYNFRINTNVRTDLQNSPTYRWALETGQECRKFIQHYLTAQEDSLGKLFI